MKLTKEYTVFIFMIMFFLILRIDSNLKYKLAEVVSNVRFKTITINMDKEKFDNITYYYSNEKDKTYINNIKDYVKKGEEKIEPIFGQTITHPLNIITFTTSEAFGKTFKVDPEESMAVTNLYSIYIPCDNINDYIFVHEYTHYKMRLFCDEKEIPMYKIPVWLQEGISVYASSTFTPDKFKNAKIEKVQDFKKLETSKQMSEANINGQQSYMQSYMAVRKIIELKGIDSIQQILINTKSMSFYNAFQKVVGLSIEDFQKLPLTSNVDALLKLGFKYGGEKNLNKAKETFLEATTKYPDSELAWVNLGLTYIDLGDFDNAIKTTEKLITVSNKKSNAYFNYSQLLIGTDLDKAVALAEKSAQLAKVEGADYPKYYMNYFLFVKNLKDNLNLDKPFAQYVTLIKSEYINSNMLKIHIINQVLAKYPDKNDKSREQLIKIKSDLEKQK